ncbi:serine dehydrogenasease [Candidatus Poribacteria bacterium]|nr:MAG: serine dehydrogenasease [Candidatus Poribacteria bacterium]
MTQRPVRGNTRDSLNEYLNRLEDVLQSDVLTIFGPIRPGLENITRDSIERLRNHRSRIAVVLDTVGGIVEVVERMVTVIRHHYNEVDFLVPDRAMSAGTVLVMAGDKIFMNYFSCLGPIDPQIQKDGKFVPAMSYLNQYQRFSERAESGQLNMAELILLNNFDPGELYQFEQARLLSQDLLTKWLSTYKFRDWDTHSSTGAPVTAEERTGRAEEIAKVLGNYERWRSHGRAISRDTLVSEPIRLKIEKIEDNPYLPSVLERYFRRLERYMYMQRNRYELFVHTRNTFNTIRSAARAL